MKLNEEEERFADRSAGNMRITTKSKKEKASATRSADPCTGQTWIEAVELVAVVKHSGGFNEIRGEECDGLTEIREGQCDGFRRIDKGREDGFLRNPKQKRFEGLDVSNEAPMRR